MTLLRCWQVLFLTLLMVCLGLAVQVLPTLKIDTDLADISPTNQHRPEIQRAVDALQQNISQRIILLISGEDEEAVLAAYELLRKQLSSLETIELLPDEIATTEQLVDRLKPYRFSLLTRPQQQTLAQQSAQTIAEQARQSLYGLSGQVRAFSFVDDPLGWHSDTLMSLIPASTGENLDHPFSQSVTLMIRAGAMSIRTQEQVSTQLDQIIKDTTQAFDVNIDRAGVFFFAADAAQTSKQDVSVISTGSTLGVVLLLLLVFRNIRALLLPFISIAMGIGFAFLVTHWWYGQVHILTIVFGASLIGIVIDYSLHFFYHGANQQEANRPDERNALFRALALSLVTSVIGYMALGFSGLPALQKVALFSCCGLFMAWLSVVCLGDLALKKPMTTEQRWFPYVVVNFARLLATVPVLVWASLAGLLILIAVYTAFIIKPFNDDPRVFFTPSPELLASEQRVATVTSDYEPGQYIIVNGNNHSELYQRHHQMMTRISGSTILKPESLTSLLSWVPEPQQQHQHYRALAKLYAPHGAADRLYALLGNPAGSSSIQQDYQRAADRVLDLNTVTELLGDVLPPVFYEDTDQVVSIVLIRKGVDATALASLLTEMPGVEYINTLKRTESALAEQRRAALSLLMLAYLLVAGLMWLRFQQWRAALLVTVPLSATAALFVVSQLAGFPLNLFHVMALFLVLGFGMDYAIFTHELRQRREVTLQAILLSALTSLLSFGLLSTSTIPVVASFGTTLLVGNLFNLFGAFVYARIQSEQYYE